MTNTYSFAKSELDILIKSFPDPANRPLVEPFVDEILALCEKFGQNGDSGNSAPYVANAISYTLKLLLLQETITPISGIEQEWVCVSNGKDGILWQNSRCSQLFKEEDGRAYFIDAIVKKTQKGHTYSGSFWLTKEDYLAKNTENQIGYKHYVKSFPFTPKTFYIDVIEEEVARDDWEMYLKDPKQLEKVWKYYDKKPL